MKKQLLVLTFIYSFFFTVYGQDNNQTITNPYPLFPITNVTAEVDQKGVLNVLVEFANKYPKTLKAYFKVGGFGNFGVIDSKGKKYQIFTNEKLLGASHVIEGFYPIFSVSFGNYKQKDFTYVQDTVPSSQNRIFKFSIPKFDRNTEFIQKLVIACKPTENLNYHPLKVYTLENVKVKRK